ncbi:MAG: undecaprenyl-diphosphate phosphatase [Cyanobacteria bacterium]|nr:undecaprenyl-diphosphate phosphatase [Cyanobacteriota bacterium]
MDGSNITLFQASLLGVIQGLTEFLPISSSAHLRVVPSFLGWGDPGAAYTAVLQLGSVVAVITYFRKQLYQLATGTIESIAKRDFSSTEFKLTAGIIIGTIPICVIGLALKHLLEQAGSPLRSLWLIGAASIAMGILLIFAERIGSQKRSLQDMGIKDGLIVGLGQAMALIPGCSRSGSTLTVSLFLGLNRADSARFSFLLGVPAIVLSGLVEVKELFDVGLGNTGLVSLGAGLLTSTVVSYLSIVWMIKFLERHSTMCFVAYRMVFGVAVLAFALNLISPIGILPQPTVSLGVETVRVSQSRFVSLLEHR